MADKERKIMRGFKKVIMVTILEGDGIEDSPYREVRYFYDDEEDRIVGVYDAHANGSSPCATPY